MARYHDREAQKLKEKVKQGLLNNHVLRKENGLARVTLKAEEIRHVRPHWTGSSDMRLTINEVKALNVYRKKNGGNRVSFFDKMKTDVAFRALCETASASYQKTLAGLLLRSWGQR